MTAEPTGGAGATGGTDIGDRESLASSSRTPQPRSVTATKSQHHPTFNAVFRKWGPRRNLSKRKAAVAHAKGRNAKRPLGNCAKQHG